MDLDGWIYYVCVDELSGTLGDPRDFMLDFIPANGYWITMEIKECLQTHTNLYLEWRLL